MQGGLCCFSKRIFDSHGGVDWEHLFHELNIPIVYSREAQNLGRVWKGERFWDDGRVVFALVVERKCNRRVVAVGVSSKWQSSCSSSKILKNFYQIFVKQQRHLCRIDDFCVPKVGLWIIERSQICAVPKCKCHLYDLTWTLKACRYDVLWFYVAANPLPSYDPGPNIHGFFHLGSVACRFASQIHPMRVWEFDPKR